MIARRLSNDIFKQYLTFDDAGQITKQMSQQGSGSWLRQDYFYDDLGQLTQWRKDSGTGYGEFYTYDSVGNRLNLYNENSTGAITSWRNYDIGRRTDTSAGPNQMLKRLSRTFFSTIDYTTYEYDPDGAQNRRKLYNSSGTLQLDERFSYSSWRGLSWKYERTNPNLIGANTWEWRYRYNAIGEREQKRETLNPGGDGTAANGYNWTYYLLGGNKQQLSVWEGLQTSDATFCTLPWGGGSYVHLYPSEYLTYGGLGANLLTKPTGTAAATQEYRIADHLGSNRVVLSGSGGAIISTTDYQPFGKPLSGSTPERQSFIDKEQDVESQLGNFGVRSYDYDAGRFTSIDPLWELTKHHSPYSYAYNNPLTLIDKSGLIVEPQNLTADEMKNYLDFKSILQQWAQQSPTIKRIIENAYGSNSLIHLYGFSISGLKENQEGTMSVLHPDFTMSLDAAFRNGSESRQGLTIRKIGNSPMRADVMLSSDDVLFFGIDESVLGEIALIDELFHATAMPKKSGSFDHLYLYTSLLNEIESGRVDLAKIYPNAEYRQAVIDRLRAQVSLAFQEAYFNVLERSMKQVLGRFYSTEKNIDSTEK